MCFNYAPVLLLIKFKTNLTIANETATPNITSANVPNVVKALLLQNNVVNPLRNSDVKSEIKPKPLVIALIISAPIIMFSFQ